MERPFKPGERKKGRVTQVSVNTLKEDREKLGPKKFKELMEGQKKTGMLIGGQAKLDKNKNNKIDAEDFKILKAEKSKKKKVFGAKRGMSFDEKMKAVEQGKIDKKTGKFTSMNAMRESKGFKPGENAQDFMKRRKEISRLGKVAKATKFGKLALGVGALGVAASQLLKKKLQEKKENKKMGGGLAAATAKLKAQGRMGGGMMKKYSVGGGLDMGGPKGKIMQSIKNKKKNSERLTRRDKQFLEEIAKDKGGQAYSTRTPPNVFFDVDGKPGKETFVSKKMGGGMMKPMGYKSGKSVKAKCKLGKNKPTKLY
jgi:hypothetical protein